MKKRNGFTLVELLAVIVVLAIIMIIAIPSVLNVMNSARKSSFAIYVKKVVNAVQTQYAYDSNLGDLAGAGLYVYNIATDLNLTSTGSYKGYIVVDARDVDAPHYIVYMYDNNYEIFGWDVSNVTNMNSMFAYCYCININLNNWNVSNVTNMSNMFYECESFEGKGLENWDVNNVKHANFMFKKCTKFNCDLNNWKTKNFTKNMTGMFDYCTSLKNTPSWYKE